MGEKQWEQVVQITSAISGKVSKNSKAKILFPDVNVHECESRVEKAQARYTRANHWRLLGDDLTVTLVVRNSILAITGHLQCLTCGDSVLLTRGQTLPRIKTGEGAGSFGNCFIYSDRDFYAEAVGNCVLVCSGKVHAERQGQNVVIENCRSSPNVRMFSLEMIGLEVIGNDGRLRVKGVTAKSVAADAGFQADDQIEEKRSVDSNLDLLRRVRLAIAIGEDLPVLIRRKNVEKTLILPLN